MSISINIKRVSILALSVLFAASIYVVAIPNQIGMVSGNASDQAGQCDSGWDKKFDDNPRGDFNYEGVMFTITESTVTVSGGDAVICVKASNNNSGEISLEDGETYTVDFTNQGDQSPGISNVVVYSVYVDDTPDPVNYCDPSQQPAGMSIAEWLAEGEFDGADCFEVEVVQVCGSLDVSVTGPEGIAWGARWVYGDESNITEDFMGDGGFPATFEEGEGDGNVDVTYYLVGGESDYLVGFDLPNWWERSGVTLNIDTNCEDDVVEVPEVPEEETEAPDTGDVLGDTDEKEEKDEGEILAATTVRSLPETGSSASIVAGATAMVATVLAMASTAIKSAFVRFTV